MAPYQKVVDRPATRLLGWWSALLPLSAPAAVVGAALSALSLWWLALAGLAVGVPVLFALVVGLTVNVSSREQHRARFRATVGLLHVLQPFARAWGRLRARPVDLRPSPQRPWKGDRAEWLAQLREELAGRGCVVRPASAHQAWDFTVRRGPFVSARVITAVTWNWSPHHRARLWPRWWLAVVAAAALLSWAVAPLLAGVLGALVICAVSVEGWSLRSRVLACLREAGSKANAPSPEGSGVV